MAKRRHGKRRHTHTRRHTSHHSSKPIKKKKGFLTALIQMFRSETDEEKWRRQGFSEREIRRLKFEKAKEKMKGEVKEGKTYVTKLFGDWGKK